VKLIPGVGRTRRRRGTIPPGTGNRRNGTQASGPAEFQDQSKWTILHRLHVIFRVRVAVTMRIALCQWPTLAFSHRSSLRRGGSTTRIALGAHGARIGDPARHVRTATGWCVSTRSLSTNPLSPPLTPAYRARNMRDKLQQYLAVVQRGEEPGSSARISFIRENIDISKDSSTIISTLNDSKNSVALAMALREDALISADVSADFRELGNSLKAWLSVALNVDAVGLHRITFEASTGETLEKIAKGEHVHHIRYLRDLKTRLSNSRRCFGLFHPALPNEPLAFVHIALIDKLATSLDHINEAKELASPSHAIFYSVNSSRSALTGLNIASRVIKQAAESIKHEFPSVTVFSTLSPVPGIANWVKKIGQQNEASIATGVFQSSRILTSFSLLNLCIIIFQDNQRLIDIIPEYVFSDIRESAVALGATPEQTLSKQTLLTWLASLVESRDWVVSGNDWTQLRRPVSHSRLCIRVRYLWEQLHCAPSCFDQVWTSLIR
jgi:Malonyl-CoA decarboxylase C-terminal domain